MWTYIHNITINLIIKYIKLNTLRKFSKVFLKNLMKKLEKATSLKINKIYK